MPVKEAEFSMSALWPASSSHWMAPGAVASVTAQYGAGLDVGALRVRNGFWEILLGGPSWVVFEPTNKDHYYFASGFRRYGPGWSYGPGHNMHDEVSDWFHEVFGRQASPMEKLDYEHDKAMYQSLLKAYQEKIGFKPGEPPPTAPPPQPPPVPPPAGQPPPVDQGTGGDGTEPPPCKDCPPKSKPGTPAVVKAEKVMQGSAVCR